MFTDVLQDLNDALSMCFHFSTFLEGQVPDADHSALPPAHCGVPAHHCPCSLLKVFLSIKGTYDWAEVLDHPITWFTPYAFSHDHLPDVDYRVMDTFTEFYTTLLGFVCFLLSKLLNLHSRPKLQAQAQAQMKAKEDAHTGDSESSMEKMVAFSVSLFLWWCLLWKRMLRPTSFLFIGRWWYRKSHKKNTRSSLRA